MQDMQVDFEKNFQMDDMNEDDLLTNFPLEKGNIKDKFTVKNLDNLKMVFKKGASIGEEPLTVNAGMFINKWQSIFSINN